MPVGDYQRIPAVDCFCFLSKRNTVDDTLYSLKKYKSPRKDGDTLKENDVRGRKEKAFGTAKADLAKLEGRRYLNGYWFF